VSHEKVKTAKASCVVLVYTHILLVI